MTLEEKKVLLSEAMARITRTNDKRDSYLREIADDKATLELIGNKELAGDPMPSYSPYPDYTTWREIIQKEIDRAETTLSNLDIRLIEAEAFQYYIDNYTEV